MPSTGFYADIERICTAHEYVLDRVHRCEYPRGRGSYGLIYALSGKAEYRFFTGERFSVGEGDVLFLSPYAAYSILTEKEFKHYTVNFDIHGESSCLAALRQPYRMSQGEGTERLERIFKRLVGIWNAKKAGYDMQAVGCLYELLATFYFDYVHRQPSVTSQRLLPARELIEQHFDTAVTLQELARLSGMSVTNFRREWRKLYAQSPLQYRDAVRLSCAKEHLSGGYYTVSEIAEKCGFDDVSYFVRFFKQKTGFTPGEFKKKFLGR